MQSPSLQKQGCPLTRQPIPLEERQDMGQMAAEPLSERGQVVAGIQDVGHSALLLLLPQLVGVGREVRPSTFPADLQRETTHSQHPPHNQQDEVICLQGYCGKSASEVRVQRPLEDVQGDE